MIPGSVIVALLLLVPTLVPALEPGAWRRLAHAGSAEMVTAIAIDRGIVAVGRAAGGVEIVPSSLSTRLEVRDPVLGAKARIHALAFFANRLWIASEGGLYPCDPVTGAIDRGRGAIPAPLRSGVKVLLARGDALWCASSRSVAILPAGAPESLQEWKLPVDDVPTSLLQVGTRILVGTASSGLLVLDSATGSWARLGAPEGLSSEQVTAIEQVGAEAFLATPEGIDALDLSTQKVRPQVSRSPAFWMTQANGRLRISTTDGLLDFEASTRRATLSALPDGARPEGAIAWAEDLFAVACGAEVLVRTERTILGSEHLRLDKDGFRLRLPARPPSGTGVQAFLRLPEWLETRFPVVVESSGDGKDLLLRIPPDLRGLVQIDVSATVSGKVQELRSLVGIADRGRPALRMEPVSPIVRDSAVPVRGMVSGVGPFTLLAQPGGVRMAVGRDGAFQGSIPLRRGSNRLSLQLADGLGNATSREFEVSRDADAPVFGIVRVDTVPGDLARIRVPYRDENAVQATTRATSLARASVFDSFVILEVRHLSVGENTIELQLVDQAGNRGTTTIRVVRRGDPASGDPGYRRADEILSSTDPPWGVRAARWDGSGGNLNVLHYRMVEGETLCGVAEKFYGTQPLAEILIRWNGFADSSQWRKMPVGTPVDVPFWTDFEFGKLELREALATFPWALLPADPRSRR